MSSSGSTFGPQQVEDQEHLGGPAADAADADQLLDDRLVVHLAASAPTWTAPDCEVLARGRTGTRPCAPTGPRRACRGASSASTAFGASGSTAPAVSATKRSHTACAALTEICWPTIDARQRGERVAAALQAAVAEAAGSASSSPGRACDRCLQASSQYSATSGRRSAHRAASPRLSAFTQVVPWAMSLSTMPCAGSSSRMRSARGEVARLLGRGARLDALGDASLRRAPLPACRKARGACCSMPERARPAPSAAPRRAGLRCGSLRRPARTAPPPRSGVLKSSFIAARKRGRARLAPVDRAAPPAATASSAV